MSKFVNVTIQKGPTKRIVRTKGATERTIELRGQWDNIADATPSYGDAVAGYPGFVVVRAEATELPGGGGRILATIRKAGTDVDAAPDPDKPIVDRVSVRWVRSQRALADSAYFTAGSSTDAKMSQIECWKREKSHALREAYKFSAPVLYGTTAVQWETFEITDAKTLKLAKKIKAGQTGYWWWYPVVRRRREYDKPATPDLEVPTILTAASLKSRLAGKPIPSKGLQKDVSGAMESFTYQFMLVGMELEEGDSDHWSLTEEWLGAKEFDADYYGT